jgi:hypothetical protein
MSKLGQRMKNLRPCRAQSVNESRWARVKSQWSMVNSQESILISFTHLPHLPIPQMGVDTSAFAC